MQRTPAVDESRRNFLKKAGLIGAGLPLFSPLRSGATAGPTVAHARSGNPLPSRPEGSGSRVVIIGAGLAGLVAGYELRRAGHDVRILEARGRPGGRVRSVSDPFADELRSELGAVVFSGAYAVANHYIDVFGLERLPFAIPDLASVYHVGGRRFSVKPGGPVDRSYDLTASEAQLGPIGLVLKYLVDALPKNLRDPDAWQTPAIRELDQVSLADFLRRQGASEGAVRLVEDALYFGWEPENASMLSIALTDMGLFFTGAGMFVLKGGNDQLPRAMAQKLSGAIDYGSEVTGIEMDDAGVSVSVRSLSEERVVRADRVILTVPATVMQRIPVSPGLPDTKHEAIKTLNYHTILRAQFQMDSAFWRERGESGAATTDLFGGRVDRQPYHDVGAADRRAILDALIIGPDAERLGKGSRDEILGTVSNWLAQIHPGFDEHVETGVIKDWNRDPYTLGGWSWPQPGWVTQHLDNLRAPFQRLHFAGEHTSLLRATMEGALRSGIRAAHEVDAISQTRTVPPSSEEGS